jgi:hypothetical protein
LNLHLLAENQLSLFFERVRHFIPFLKKTKNKAIPCLHAFFDVAFFGSGRHAVQILQQPLL